MPFEFVLDHMVPLNIMVKQMFGLWAIYVDDKIVLALRQRSDLTDTNGVWVATKPEYHTSLRNEIRSLRSFSIYSKAIKETEWLLLPEYADDFESSVIMVCGLIKKGDPRIGKIPVPRKRKKANRN